MDGPPDDDAPGPGPGTWSGLQTSPATAIQWGIDLCGQLAAVHDEGIVNGRIRPETVLCSVDGEVRLPERDPRADHEPWRDVAALANAIAAIVISPPRELVDALLPPYASAIALGQELQDAQRALGLPVTDLAFVEVRSIRPGRAAPVESADDHDADPAALLDELGFDPGRMGQTPNLLALFAVVIMVGIAATALGIGWR